MNIKFNFNPNKIKIKNNKIIIPKRIILHKKIKGVINITIKGDYFISTEQGNYKFTNESYIIKPNKSFYAQQLVDSKRVCIKEINSKRTSVKGLYLPFAPGIIGIGNIVKDCKTNLILFELKKTEIDKNNLEAKEALKYFREHYDEIYLNMRNGK